MSDQALTETVAQLMAQMAVMQAKIDSLQAQVQTTTLNATRAEVKSLPSNPSRRSMLRRLAGGLLAGLAVTSVAAIVPEQAEAKLIINPNAQAGRIGALILRNGGSGTISGALPNVYTFGLIATNAQSLDLTQIGSGDSGVVGLSPAGNGVTGKSSSFGASGVYGENSSGGFGVAGRSNLDSNSTGVLGESTSGKGVSALSSTGYGVYGSSTSGTAVAGYSQTGTGTYGNSVDGMAVSGNSTNNYGVSGYSTNNHGTAGISTTQGHAGVYASNTHLYGAQLRLAKGTNSGPAGNHFAGEFYVDNVGRLWYCFTDGNTYDQSNWQLVVSS